MEVIISMAIIAIMSVGVYNAYLLLIRQTKDGEVKQRVALVGKKIIEDIKGDTDGKSFEVTDKMTTLDLDDDIKLDKKEVKDSHGNQVKDKDGNIEYYFEKEVYLNKDFVETTGTDKVYTQQIKLEKAKATKDNDEYNMDLDKKIVSAGIDVNMNKIPYNLNLTEGVGAKIYINDDDSGLFEVPKNSEGKIVLNVYIKTEDGANSSKTKNVSVKDLDGKLILPEVKELDLDDHKINQLYLSINFDGYKKQESGTLNTEINIYNYDQETTDNITNINIEKPRDLDIDVKTRKGEVNIYNDRTKDTDVVKLGTLYNVQIDIKDKDGQNLFSGYSNQNINIK